jgi:multidrug efflux system outer membrane protein
MARAKTAALAACLALAGCFEPMGPNHQRPATMPVPAAYRVPADAPASADSIADLPWWQVFDDPALTALIGEAVANNRDVKVAVARVEQARARAAIVDSRLRPQVGINAQVSREEQAVLGTPFTGLPRTPTSTYLFDLPISWEIDLWGRLRRADEAARAELLATDEVRRGVLLTLVGGLANAWYTLATLDRQRAVIESTITAYRQTFDLFALRRQGGVGTAIEARAAAAQLARAQAALPLIDKSIQQTENLIAILAGRPPGAVTRGRPLEAMAEPVAVPAGLPAQLLDRRPDLRAAEARLRAANARIGIAEANYYPRIALTGAFGVIGQDLPQIVNGTTNVWSVVGNIAGPLFTGGRLDAEMAAAKAGWEEARQAYEQTMLAALREVADALAERAGTAAARRDLAIAVADYATVIDLVAARYLNGLSPYFEVIIWQERLFPAQIELADIEGQTRRSLVRLYLSLGGGWRLTDDDWAGPAAIERRRS